MVGYTQPSSNDLRNAFKTNAWMQISHISSDEAKELYIETINSLLNKK
jgi:acyl-CoA-binding protein